MPKLTKTQQRRLANDIISKAQKLWSSPMTGGKGQLTTKDFIAIEAIMSRTLKRIG